MPGHVENRMKDNGVSLPGPTPFETQQRLLDNGNTLICISAVSLSDHKPGKIGRDVSIENGQALTRTCALQVVANLKAACEHDLDRVVRCVKVTAFINADEDFREHPLIVDGASDLLVQIFGEDGKHTRSAIGMDDMPTGTAVKIDAIFEIAPSSTT